MNTVRKLLANFQPTHYNLSLDLSKQTERVFSGTVDVEGKLAAESDRIVLHSNELTITSANINGKAVTWEQGKDDEMAFISGTKLPARDYILTIGFEGKINDTMHGLYPSYFKLDGKDSELMATQLESHYAREVFPLVDEPAAKATFDLSLTTEAGLTAIANTPVKSQHEDGKKLTTIFKTTPVMSPYLLAFVTGKLAYTETTNKNDVLIRAYSVPGKEHQTKFALNYAAKTLEFLDEFFDIPYPLPKLDLMALPDFSSAAMENWGLVTFREAYMLVDEENTPADMKELIAEVIMHELAHQWFGNLVTMKWWDDLWLNESFAKWMENYGVDKLDPQWRTWEQFGATEQQYAFSRDGLANVQSVREPVNHPEELNSLFDPAIVYAKGACLIRMLQNYLGETAFRDGLRVYMKRHQYGNAEADDLWTALSEVSDKDVRAFMHPWLQQSGHPVVAVSLTDEGVALSQHRFCANPTQVGKEDPLWPLPLLSDQIATDILQVRSAVIRTSAKPVMLNKDFTGFYHTQYSADMLAAIAAKLSELSVVDRQGLLVDGIALTRAGLQPTVNLMELLAHYRQEKSYAVWQSMASVTGVVRTLINDDPAIKPNLQKYVAALAEPQFKRLGWKRIKDESYFDELLRPTAIGLMAYAEVPAVVKHALKMFDDAKKPEDIKMPELRGIVYSVAVRERGEPAYNKLLDWYKTTNSADERVTLVAGIGGMRDPELAKKATALFMTKTIKPQDIAYWFIHLIRNRYARKVVWQWMQDNWGWIEKQFKNSHDYGDFPKYSSGAFSTREELAMYKEFFEPKLKEADIAILIKQGIEEIESRALWRERDLEAIATYLAQQAKQ
jgi:aminopeptidase N